MASTELPIEELARRITGAAVQLAAATAAWLALIAEFDRREGWGGSGIRSCAHWLAWQCGLSTGTAREHVRVARALAELPATAAAFAGGRLSYSKVRAISRVADPATEGVLLELAHDTTASQLERAVREWRRDEKPPPRTVRDRLRFDHWSDEHGMVHIRLCLDAETGAALLARVDSLADREARRDRAAAKKTRTAPDAPGDRHDADDAADTPNGAPAADPPAPDDEDVVFLARERTTARRCAALGRLATAAAEADRSAGDPPRREVVVHVDATVLADDAAAGSAYLEGGPALHPAQVRRMLCQATVLTLLERGREPLAHGRARRFATRAQRRALYRRDRGCARPGCPETRPERLHAHHLRHWLFGGATDVSNMALLCDTDHGLVHDEDLILFRRDGRLVALTQDGRHVWGRPDAEFRTGLTGTPPTGPQQATDSPARDPHAGDAFAGVHPIDTARARRPDVPAGTPPPSDAAPATGTATLTRLLFPDAAPDLPDTWHVNGERMDLEWVVWALLGQRDLARRLAADQGTETDGADLTAVA